MSVLTRNRVYRQSLPKYMSMCEQNYFRIMQLMPANEAVDESREILVGHFHFKIEVVESTKYTSLIRFSQLGENIIGFIRPDLHVRVYHDARMAEVICQDYHSRIRPSYDYPNPQMRQKDEKYQINAFLLDWLDYCISHGRSQLHWDINNGLV